MIFAKSSVPPPSRHKKESPLNAELLIERRLGGFKGNREAIKNVETVRKRGVKGRPKGVK